MPSENDGTAFFLPKRNDRKKGKRKRFHPPAVLALNLHKLMKHRLLPEEYGKSRPKTIRFLLYTMVGKIVTHGRRTVLKIWTGDRGGTLFASVMKRLELLQSMPD
ncbi:MAG: hypothetical protein PHO98_07885 [Synergistaceae bacterium]|nr:hypothetical protein [Synergistaceae bacterium]